jgi:hypothetical protein
MNFTPERVKAFYAAAAKQYDAEFVDRRDSDLMKLIGTFLDGIGVLDKEKFLNDFTTTIGNIVYIGYTPGDTSSGHSLAGQVETAVHEIQHIIDFDDDPVGFMVRYLVDKSARTEYECRAYAAGLEWTWKTTGKSCDIGRAAQSLLSYGLQQQHCDFMRQYLDVQDDVFRQGGAVSPVVAWAWKWFQEHPA